MKKLFSAMLCVGLLFGCGSDGSSEPKEKVFVKDSEITSVYSDPDSFKGKYITVSGMVFGDVQEKDGKIAFQMWRDPANVQNNTVVYASSDVKDLIKEEAIVTVTGYIDGAFDGENAFGGSVTAPKIIAESVEETDYASAFAPAIKKFDVNEAKKSHNVTVTLEKVEVAKSQTRVYLTIDNKSGHTYNVYSFNTKILQDSKQYEEETDYEANYDQINTDLLDGAKTSGIITFKKIDESKNFKVIVEGQSENYDWDSDTFTYEVSVK